MGEFCVVASPPLQVWRSSAGSPEFLVRAGRCDGVFVVCGRHPSVKSDRMSASPRSTRHPELVSGSVEGTRGKEKRFRNKFGMTEEGEGKNYKNFQITKIKGERKNEK